MKENFFEKVFIYWFPALSWSFIIFYLSHQSNLTSGLEYDLFLRKSAHILEFFILFVLLFRAFLRAHNFSFGKVIVFSLIFSLLYAASDEFHQSFIEGRVASILDWTIDSIGIFFALLVIFLLKTKKPHWLGL